MASDPTALLTERQAAQYLAISQNHLRMLTDNGEVRFINVGLGRLRQRRRYQLDDLTDFIATRRECVTIKSAPQKPANHNVADFSVLRDRINARRANRRT